MMSALCAVMVVALAVVVGVRGAGGSKYTFYRTLREVGQKGVGVDVGTGTRRVFGGAKADLNSFPAVCALLDRYWSVRCSGALLSPRWVLTAAHCVSPRITYVKYNTRRAVSSDGDYAPVYYLYRHPKYKVVQEDEGRGMDVTLLHHDVGLVCTRTHMSLRSRLPLDPVVALRRYNAFDLHNEEVEVLGFGHTEAISTNEELSSAKLELVYCERGAWFHCVCGVNSRRGRAGPPGPASGVCSGDSGGPVVYRGVQVGVTSMGPTECSAGESPDERSTSVFTALYKYADLVNATITDAAGALRMERLSAAPLRLLPHPLHHVLPLLPAALALLAT